MESTGECNYFKSPCKYWWLETGVGDVNLVGHNIAVYQDARESAVTGILGVLSGSVPCLPQAKVSDLRKAWIIKMRRGEGQLFSLFPFSTAAARTFASSLHSFEGPVYSLGTVVPRGGWVGSLFETRGLYSYNTKNLPCFCTLQRIKPPSFQVRKMTLLSRRKGTPTQRQLKLSRP